MILSIFGEFFNILNLYDLYISFQNSNCWQISILYDENIQITSREYYNNNDIDESLCEFVSVCVLETSTYNGVRELICFMRTFSSPYSIV